MTDLNDVWYTTVKNVNDDWPIGTRIVGIAVPSEANIEQIVQLLIKLWITKYSTDFPVTSRFVTICFISSKMFIELSDRFRSNGS